MTLPVPKAVAFWATRIGLIALLTSLALSAALRLVSGIATDRAFPVPTYLLMDVPQSASAYAAASRALAFANPHDGAAKLGRAEAAQQLGVPSAEVARLLIEGLRMNPASARGWVLLAESDDDRHRAADAERMALSLAPNEFWLLERRVAAAARLWEALDPASRSAAQAQVRQLWETPALRAGLPLLLQTQAGADLLTSAYRHDPETLRQINAWVSHQRMAGS